MSYIAKNLAKVLAGAVIIGAGYTALKPNDGFLHGMMRSSEAQNERIEAKTLEPYNIIVREGDSIEMYRLNCAPNTTPLDYRNAILDINEKETAGLQQGELLEALIDRENANEWCENRIIGQNRHLNE